MFHDKTTSSRRDLLSLGTAAGVMSVLGAPGAAHAAVHDHESAQYSLSVKTFGAVGDAATDDTAAFQRALDAAHTEEIALRTTKVGPRDGVAGASRILGRAYLAAKMREHGVTRRMAVILAVQWH